MSSAGLLTGKVIALGPACIFKFNGKMVVDIPVLRVCPHLAPPGAHGLKRHYIAHGPRHHSPTMDSLLHDNISRQPVVIIPVSHLISHFVPIGLTRQIPRFPSVSEGADRFNFTDIAVQYIAEGSAVRKIVTEAEAGND